MNLYPLKDATEVKRTLLPQLFICWPIQIEYKLFFLFLKYINNRYENNRKHDFSIGTAHK